MALKLRPYQQRSVDAVLGEYRSGADRASLVLPTGGGKTIVFGEIIRQILDEKPGSRALVVAHRDELVRQAVDKVGLMTGLRCGIVKAQQDDVDARVVVASVQTIANPERWNRLGRFDVTVCDEAHHYAAETYRDVVDRCGWFTLGVTATMNRSDGCGLGSVWPDPCHTEDIMSMIRLGYLVDIKARTVAVQDLDLSKVRKVAGDYGDKALADAIADSGAVREAVAAWQKYAGGRSTVAFAPDVATAQDLRDAFLAVGVAAECITGKTTTEERQAAYRRHARGETTVLTSCMVLTEGWDAPHAEVALLLRPTKSRSLFTQMVGRVLRTHPGKADALLLDVTGASEDHTLASIIDLSPTIPKDRKPKDDEEFDLLAVEEEEAAKREHRRATRSRQVDLFRDSHSVWLRTPGGRWFIPAEKCIVWVEDSGSEYRVGRTGSQYAKRGGGWLSEPLEDLELAMSLAEQAAEDLSPDLNTHGEAASWRKGGAAPDKQVALLMRIYPRATEGQCRALSKGQAAEKISLYYAARCLDR